MAHCFSNCMPFWHTKDDGDVDLCIETSISGLAFVGLVEELRTALHKRVELIRLSDFDNNIALIKEISKDGIIIYNLQSSLNVDD